MTYYNKGVYFERLTQHWLERNNYYVMRSAGSHGIFDLLAIPIDRGNTSLLNHDNYPLTIYANSAIQLKSFENNNFVLFDSYPNFNILDLGAFKDYKFLVDTHKYLFIYNRAIKTQIPQIYEYVNNEWNKIQ